MNNKFIFIAFVTLCWVLATSGHQINKRQSPETNSSWTVLATDQWTQFLGNAWNSLNSTVNSNETQTKINRIQANLTNWRDSLVDASGDMAQNLMANLRNVSHRLNSILRERATNDQNLVHRLYDMLINTTKNGTNNSMETMRQAITTATQTMAENYASLANHSLELASDMRDKGVQLFNTARIRAGNDTNRAVIAVNTALNAIKNSSQPINEAVQEVAANLTNSVQQLSAQLRNVISQSPTNTPIEAITGPEFRQKAEQSLEKVKSSMNQLRNSLDHFATNANTNDHNVEDNEIIQRASRMLSKEAEELQNQINGLIG